jgi:hypothetical protein
MRPPRRWSVNRILVACGALGLTACASDEPSTPLFSGTTVAILDAPDDGVLLQDSTRQLRAVVRDADGTDVPGVSITWRSSDETRARVTADGRVTALALGELELRATAGGAFDAREMSVRAAVPAPLSRDGDPVTSTLLGGVLRLTVPPRAIPSGGVLHVRPARDTPADERVIGSTAVELGPGGMRFDESVTISLAVPEDIPLGERLMLRLARVDDDEWDTVGGSVIDGSLGRVRANITRAGTYAIRRRNAPSSLAIADGDGQSAGLNGVVPIRPSVIARDEEQAPVQGAVVRFAVTGGGGAIVGPDSGVAGADGVAALEGEWRLGGVTGQNSLRAALPGSAVPPVSFTATALAQPSIVVSHPEVNFEAEAGANPPPRDVQVTSSTSQQVTGLSVGPVAYVQGDASGWLNASLDRGSTPAVLRVAPATSALPVRDYIARVPLRSSVAGVRPDTVEVRVGVRPGTAAALVVTRQLSGATSGRVAGTQPRVEFRTASGAVAPVASAVTVEVASGNGTLVGTTTVSAVAGVATFAGLRIDGYGTHRLRFSAGGLATDGASFTVSQQLAALEIETQPGGGEEDQPFAQQPVILLLDDAGLRFQPAKTVTASIASGDGDLEGTTAVVSQQGVARFTNLRIDDGEGTFTLRFRTTSPTRTVISAPFVIDDD